MLGIVSDDDFDSVLSDLSRAEIKEIKKGRGEKPNTPEVLRDVIAEEGVNGVPNEELAKLFGVSPASVSAYKNGATSTATYNQPNDRLQKTVLTVKERIKNKAGKKLRYAIDAMTEDEIACATVVEKATIAKSLATVFKSMEEEVVDQNKSGVQFVIFAPQIKKEDDYDVIDVSSEVLD